MEYTVTPDDSDEFPLGETCYIHPDMEKEMGEGHGFSIISLQMGRRSMHSAHRSMEDFEGIDSRRNAWDGD